MSGEIESITTTSTLLPGGVNNVPTTLQDTLLSVLETPYSLKQIEKKLYDKKIHIISHGYLKGYLNAMMDNGLIYTKNIDNITMYSTNEEYSVTRRRCTNCGQLLFVFSLNAEVTCSKCNQRHYIVVTFDNGAQLKPIEGI